MGRSIGILGFIAGGAALGGVGWWLYASEPAEQAEEARPPYVLPVTLATVERGDVHPSALLTGTVRSPSRASLAFEVAGLLEALEVREVDQVRTGDVLARLRAREPELWRESARADLALAERELEKLRAGTREETKRELAARRDVVRAEQALAEVEVARGHKLVADKVISQADLDRLVAVNEAAKARAEAAEQVLAEALAGTRAEDLAIAEARVDVARAQLELAEAQIEKTLLRAPSDGVVLRRFVSEGDYLAVGQAVLEVVDLAELEIDVEIPSRYATGIAAGGAVVVTIDEQPDVAIETTLDAKIPAADERSRNFRGLVRLSPEEASAATLRPGMFVRLELSLNPARDVLVVPSDAVRITEGGPTVVRVASSEGGQVGEWVPVRVIASDGERSAIETPGGELAAGDQVVLTGVDLAFPGVPLLPRSGPDDAAPEPPGAEPEPADGAVEDGGSPSSSKVGAR